MPDLASRKLERTSEPGIYRRGGKYVVVYRDAMGRQHKRTAGLTLKQAKDVKASLRTAVAEGVETEVTRETFASYAARWVETYPGRNGKGIRQETRRDYQKWLERDAIPYLGKLKLAQIRQRHLNELAAHIAARGVSETSVKLSLAPVRALFATALAANDIRVNPCAGWRTRYEQRSDEVDADQATADEPAKDLREDELRALLAEIPSEWRLFYTFLAQTGLRISEAIELRWKDIDFGRSCFEVRRRLYKGRVAPPKSKYGRRTIKLTPTTARALWPLQGVPDALVFTTATGKRIDQSNLMTRVLKPAAVRAGLGEWVKTKHGVRAESWVGHHTFRHTCASMLFRGVLDEETGEYQGGWNAKQVQIWLGHHSPEFTLKTYIHLMPEDLPAPPQLFDSLLGWGNTGATKLTETDRNEGLAQEAKTA